VAVSSRIVAITESGSLAQPGYIQQASFSVIFFLRIVFYGKHLYLKTEHFFEKRGEV